MPQSMTGFGAAEGDVGPGRLRVEVRTVNHRFFNFAPKLPADLAPLEGEIRERLRRELERGHVSVSVRWVETAEREVSLTVDVPRAQAVAARLRELRAAAELEGDVSLDLVARQPDVLRWERTEDAAVEWPALEPIVAAAAAECRAMRAREGEALAAELRHRLSLLAAGAQAIAERAPERVTRERDRLRGAVAELLDGRPADEGRIAQEIAILADKLDITEELVRFGAHLAAADAALASDAPGKQLGFLAQELGREVNTMGAKAGDAAITQHVIAMKGELEKFREQLENLQ
ncbi:MAG TPA: YicC/YloC family endoribonuclease [Gemmatimonadales bacterium]